MTERLIIEDTSIYEIDEECMRRKKLEQSQQQPVQRNENRRCGRLGKKKEPAS